MKSAISSGFGQVTLFFFEGLATISTDNCVEKLSQRGHLDQVIGLLLLIVICVAIYFVYRWTKVVAFKALQYSTRYKTSFCVGMNQSMSHGFGFLTILVMLFPLKHILRYFLGIGEIDWPIDEMQVVFIVFMYFAAVSFVVIYRYFYQLVKGHPGK